MMSGVHCGSIPLLKNMRSHKDAVLFHIQCTQLQALAHCRMKEKELLLTLLMVFPADKRSSTHHTHSLAALISALVSSQLPFSNRIAVLKIFPLKHRSSSSLSQIPFCSFVLMFIISLYEFALSKGLFAISSIGSVITTLVTPF